MKDPFNPWVFMLVKPLCYNLVSRSTFYLFYVRSIEDIALHLNLPTCIEIWLCTLYIGISKLLYMRLFLSFPLN
jgi:hypothetical protein